MRGDLGIWFPNNGDPLDWYFPADSLLSRVKDFSTPGQGSRPTTNGFSPGTAWELKTHDQWVGAWYRLLNEPRLKDRDVYFKVAGRIIKKSAKGDHSGDGFYMSDANLSGMVRAQGTIWSRHEGASYREFGKFFQDNKPVAPMEQVTWSKQIASNLRNVLLGKEDYSNVAPTDVRSALPMLACAMFLAEPARNPREWIIGKMMLDLIGEQYAAPNRAKGKPARFYVLDRVFAHPLRLDPNYRPHHRLRPHETQSGPTTDRYRMENRTRIDMPQTIEPYTTKGQLARVEGKYPASPAKSAATSQSISVADDYIQKKEASIVSRWLAVKLTALMGPTSSWRITALKQGESSGKIDLSKTNFPESPARQGCKEDFWQMISELIAERARSFA